MIRCKLKIPDGILESRQQAAEEVREFWRTARAGARAFVEHEDFQARFCAYCPAQGDEDECPTGLMIGHEKCWRVTEFRDLCRELADLEREYTGSPAHYVAVSPTKEA